jgi:hypothetical protein
MALQVGVAFATLRDEGYPFRRWEFERILIEAFYLLPAILIHRANYSLSPPQLKWIVDRKKAQVSPQVKLSASLERMWQVRL